MLVTDDITSYTEDLNKLLEAAGNHQVHVILYTTNNEQNPSKIYVQLATMTGGKQRSIKSQKSSNGFQSPICRNELSKHLRSLEIGSYLQGVSLIVSFWFLISLLN